MTIWRSRSGYIVASHADDLSTSHSQTDEARAKTPKQTNNRRHSSLAGSLAVLEKCDVCR